MANNIHYELTKSRIDQSMHTKGALRSFEIIERFLKENTGHYVLKDSTLRYLVWVAGSEKTKAAKSVERQLFAKLGRPTKRAKRKSRLTDLFKAKSYSGNYKFTVPSDEVVSALKLIDEFSDLKELQTDSIPPISISVSATFYLPGAKEYTESEEDMLSYATAHLSPNSNKVAYTLNFPFADNSVEFRKLRDEISGKCGAELESKYFSVRRGKRGGGYAFSKLMPS